jgi:uncharacterized Zn-finger protein
MAVALMATNPLPGTKSQVEFISDGFTEFERHSNKTDGFFMENHEELSRQEKESMDEYNRILEEQENSKRPVCTMPGCGKEFSSRFCLKRHYMTIHMKFKKFECNVCSRTFAQKQYLVEHLNIHTQFHPYTCQIDGCNQKFKQRSRLCLHRKQVHGIFADSKNTEFKIEQAPLETIQELRSLS